MLHVNVTFQPQKVPKAPNPLKPWFSTFENQICRDGNLSKQKGMDLVCRLAVELICRKTALQQLTMFQIHWAPHKSSCSLDWRKSNSDASQSPKPPNIYKHLSKTPGESLYRKTKGHIPKSLPLKAKGSIGTRRSLV